jgi:23S rRNA pseudouridine1911/1915/1917 synthase
MALVSKGGKAALTHYATVSVFHAAVSLLECHLATGRTHQIRVHFANAGYPIVGDPMYLRRVPAAAKGIDQPLRGHLLDFPRQALHAATLGFKHPRDGRQMRFEAALPADIQGILRDIEAYLSGS